MSQSDFQARLNRLQMNRPSTEPTNKSSNPAPKALNNRPTKLSWLTVAAFVFLGRWTAVFANEEYDLIKETFGEQGAIIVGMIALALTAIGSLLFLHALWKQFKPNTPKSVRSGSEQNKASQVFPQSKRTEQKLGPSIFLIVLFPLLYAIAANLDGLIGEKGKTSHVIFDVVVPSLSTLVLLAFVCAGLVVNIGAIFKFGRRESPVITPDMSAEQIEAIASQRNQRDGLSGILLGAGAVGYLGLGTTAVKSPIEDVTKFGFPMLLVAAVLVLSVLIRLLLILIRQRRFPWRTPIYFLASAAGVLLLFRRTSLHLSDYEPILASLAN